MVKKGKKEDSKEGFGESLSKKENEKNQDKILRRFLIGMVVLVVLVTVLVYAVKSTKKFEYEGVDFEIVKSGNLVLYNTKVPVIVNGQRANYNFYLRNDPRKTGVEVPIDGNISLAKNLVINSSTDINCDGDGIIAIANLLNLYKIYEIDVIRDESAVCDFSGRYTFIRIRAGNQTSIEEFGPKCYNLNIKNCEILKGTERLMIESFIDINKR